MFTSTSAKVGKHNRARLCRKPLHDANQFGDDVALRFKFVLPGFARL